MYYVIRPTNQDLKHHGVLGQKWGVRNGPPYPLSKSENVKKVESLSYKLKKTIKYGEFTTLKSPKETKELGKGSCHDQVILELDELKRMGIDAKARFLIEYDPKTNQGGTTHAYVYFTDSGNTYWLENAWKGREGAHRFKSVNEIEKNISNARKTGEWGDLKKFSRVEFSDFNPKDHTYGESLQELVERCMR